MDPSETLNDLEQQLTDERKKVDVDSHNFSVRELVRMMAEEELNIAPTYQRKFRWDEAHESTFIESIFPGLPVPPIFVATNVGFQWEVVDGLQRLSTLTHFLAMPEDDLSSINRTAPLKLSGLEKLSQLNGKTYSQLPRSLQFYFGRQPLQFVALTDKSDRLVRFDVFERLNRGSVELSPQEVRACVYRGDFNLFLEELALNEKFIQLLKLQELRQNDGTKAEQVLKFFAYKNSRDTFDGKVERFLNLYMGEGSKQFNYTRERALFEQSVDILFEACGSGPFLRAKTYVTPLVQFEACLVGIADVITAGHSAWIHRRNAWRDGKQNLDYVTVLGMLVLLLTVLQHVRGFWRGIGDSVPRGVRVADRFRAGQAARVGGPQASVHRFSQACWRWWPSGR